MSERVDVAIVGAGCAGLSLAWQLAKRGGRRVTLIDPRQSFERDRTWGHFASEPHDFHDLVTHRWPEVRVRARDRDGAGGGWVTRRVPGYQQLDADVFYERVLERLRATPGFEIRLGARVESVTDGTAEAVLAMDQGALSASWAFDSRPAPVDARSAPGREVLWLQDFLGQELETDAPAFDPGVATLMDFEPAWPSGVRFVYVLPTSERRALVEVTWLGPRALGDSEKRGWLEAYVKEALSVRAYRVLREEAGTIPMRAAATAGRVGQRVARIGLAGGLARPSSGYAFTAIQRQSARIAEGLDRDPAPKSAHELVPRPFSPISAALDAVFLSYLARHPERGPDLFVRLFERTPPAPLVRFLTDRFGPGDVAAVIRAMPKAALTVEAMRALRMARSALG